MVAVSEFCRVEVLYWYVKSSFRGLPHTVAVGMEFFCVFVCLFILLFVGSFLLCFFFFK